MIDIPVKVNGNYVEDYEFNSIVNELENAILSLGIALDGADNYQIGQAIAIYVAAGDFYTLTTPSANTYVLAPIGSKQTPDDYYDGMTVRGVCTTSNANTGAATVDVNSLGAKDIEKYNTASPDGALIPLVAGDISYGILELTYRASTDSFIVTSIYQASETLPGIMALASVAEAIAGAVTDKAITPATLASVFSSIGSLSEVSSNDTTAGYLEDKIVGSISLSVDVLNEGGNESLQLTVEQLIDTPRGHEIYRLSEGQTVVNLSSTIVNDTGGSTQGDVKQFDIYLNGQKLVNTQFNTLISPDSGDYTVTNLAPGQITLTEAASVGDIFVYQDVTKPAVQAAF